MKKTEEKILKFIAEKKLIQHNDRILVALSGGPDSVFLLSFLDKFKRKLKIKTGAFHLNHLIRGKEADLDEEFCREVTSRREIPFYSIRKDVQSFSLKNKISFEEAGRILRYRYLHKTASAQGFNKIATAHNCSDNAETVLLNLIKGAGLKGLSGIPAVRGIIIRPLLPVTKDEILKYLDCNKINFRRDMSNLDAEFERNFLRLSIIPLIKEKLNPSFDLTVFKSSAIIKEVNEYINLELEPYVNKAVTENEGGLLFDTEHLKKLNKNLLSFLFKDVIEKKFPVQLSFKDSARLTSLLNSDTGKKINLPGNISAFRERRKIEVFQNKTEKEFGSVTLKKGNRIKINGQILSIKENKNLPGKIHGSRYLEFVSGDNLSDRFVLRKWRAGDRFSPLGMKGTKKISDFLAEQKVPSSGKNEQLVLTNKGRIVWVVGLRIDNRFKIEKTTRKVLELCLK